MNQPSSITTAARGWPAAGHCARGIRVGDLVEARQRHFGPCHQRTRWAGRPTSWVPGGPRVSRTVPLGASARRAGGRGRRRRSTAHGSRPRPRAASAISPASVDLPCLQSDDAVHRGAGHTIASSSSQRERGRVAVGGGGVGARHGGNLAQREAVRALDKWRHDDLHGMRWRLCGPVSAGRAAGEPTTPRWWWPPRVDGPLAAWCCEALRRRRACVLHPLDSRQADYSPPQASLLFHCHARPWSVRSSASWRSSTMPRRTPTCLAPPAQPSGCVASRQSQPFASRQRFDARFDVVERDYAVAVVPRPPPYRPALVHGGEFWYGAEFRLPSARLERQRPANGGCGFCTREHAPRSPRLPSGRPLMLARDARLPHPRSRPKRVCLGEQHSSSASAASPQPAPAAARRRSRMQCVHQREDRRDPLRSRTGICFSASSRHRADLIRNGSGVDQHPPRRGGILYYVRRLGALVVPAHRAGADADGCPRPDTIGSLCSLPRRPRVYSRSDDRRSPSSLGVNYRRSRWRDIFPEHAREPLARNRIRADPLECMARARHHHGLVVRQNGSVPIAWRTAGLGRRPAVRDANARDQVALTAPGPAG